MKKLPQYTCFHCEEKIPTGKELIDKETGIVYCSTDCLIKDTADDVYEEDDDGSD